MNFNDSLFNPDAATDLEAVLDVALFMLNFSPQPKDESWPFVADLPLVSFVSVAK